MDSDFSWIKTLSHAQGKLRQIVPFSAGRARLVDLFSGTWSEAWFLQEVVDVFDLLLQYRAGISFVRRITEKLQTPMVDWVASLTQPVAIELMCKHESGIAFVGYLFDKYHEYGRVLSGIQGLLEANCTPVFQTFALGLMKTAVSLPEFHYFDIIWRFDYENRPELCCYLAQLIYIDQREKWEALVTPFVQAPEKFTEHKQHCDVLLAIAKRGSRDQYSAICTGVLKNTEMFMGPHSWTLLAFFAPMFNRGVMIRIADKITNYMETLEQLPPHFANLLVPVIWALPADERRLMLESNERKIKELQSPEIREAYEFLDYLDKR